MYSVSFRNRVALIKHSRNIFLEKQNAFFEEYKVLLEDGLREMGLDGLVSAEFNGKPVIGRLRTRRTDFVEPPFGRLRALRTECVEHPYRHTFIEEESKKEMFADVLEKIFSLPEAEYFELISKTFIPCRKE